MTYTFAEPETYRNGSMECVAEEQENVHENQSSSSNATEMVIIKANIFSCVLLVIKQSLISKNHFISNLSTINLLKFSIKSFDS